MEAVAFYILKFHLNPSSFVNWQVLPWPQIEDLSSHPAPAVVGDLADFSHPIGELVLLGGVGFWNSVNNLPGGRNRLLGLHSVIVGKDGVGLHSLTVVNVPPTIVVVHHSVKLSAPLLLQDGLEEVVLLGEVEETVTHEILIDVVGFGGHHRPKLEAVIGFSLQLSREGIIGLIDLNELLVVASGIFGVVLESQPAVRLLNVVQTGVTGHFQHIVVSP